MIPIFFFWAGSDAEEVRSLGIGLHGSRWEVRPVGDMHVGVVHDAHPQSRGEIDALHEKMCVFPGPHGALQAKHVNFISKQFPKVKEGDAFHTVLSSIYSDTDLETFNPEVY